MLESITPWDASVLHAIHSAFANPMLDAIMAFFTHIGSAGAVWTAIALVLAIRKSTRIGGIGMLVTLKTWSRLQARHSPARSRIFSSR